MLVAYQEALPCRLHLDLVLAGSLRMQSYQNDFNQCVTPRMHVVRVLYISVCLLMIRLWPCKDTHHIAFGEVTRLAHMAPPSCKNIGISWHQSSVFQLAKIDYRRLQFIECDWLTPGCILAAGW